MSDLESQESDGGSQAVEVEDTSGNEQQERQLSEVEQLAVEMGWNPNKDGVGDREWLEAADFIKETRKVNRSLRKQMKGLEERLDRVAELGTKQTERMLKQQADELRAQYDAAMAENDARGAMKAYQSLQELEAEAINAAPQKNVEQDFAARNPWYGRDEEATAYAQAISNKEAAKGRSHAEQIEAVEEAMRKRFPELMGEKVATKAPPAVNAPGRPAPVRKTRGFADLPPEARKAAENYARLYKDKFGLDIEESKAEYAREYWADKAA
jgi:hypothetical protein